MVILDELQGLIRSMEGWGVESLNRFSPEKRFSHDVSDVGGGFF